MDIISVFTLFHLFQTSSYAQVTWPKVFGDKYGFAKGHKYSCLGQRNSGFFDCCNAW